MFSPWYFHEDASLQLWKVKVLRLTRFHCRHCWRVPVLRSCRTLEKDHPSWVPRAEWSQCSYCTGNSSWAWWKCVFYEFSDVSVIPVWNLIKCKSFDVCSTPICMVSTDHSQESLSCLCWHFMDENRAEVEVYQQKNLWLMWKAGKCCSDKPPPYRWGT